MPVTEATDYNPSFPYTNGHFNTIFPAMFRRQTPPAYERERIITSDDDFVDIDHLHKGSRGLAILCHGLEGSSRSQYIQGTAGILSKNGWDVTAINHRSCSGEMNKQLIMYHSGATWDLHLIIQKMAPDYDEIVLVGFSLGGNIVLKYLGDGIYPLHEKIKKVVAVSVPIDLKGGSIEISKKKNKIYDWRFLKTLRQKAFQKHQQYPEVIKIENIKKVKTLADFDHYFTGPMHGFKDGLDYYTKCSSKQFLKNITIPTLLIQALDDPFLSASCFPRSEAIANNYLNLLLSKYGGHVGFTLPGSTYYWEEIKIASFINEVSLV